MPTHIQDSLSIWNHSNRAYFPLILTRYVMVAFFLVRRPCFVHSAHPFPDRPALRGWNWRGAHPGNIRQSSCIVLRHDLCIQVCDKCPFEPHLQAIYCVEGYIISVLAASRLMGLVHMDFHTTSLLDYDIPLQPS